MKLVQRHLIKFTKNEFLVFDKLAFLSKNLYNCAVYLNRQAFFSHQPFLTMTELHHALKTSADYQALPAKKKHKNNSKNRLINLQESRNYHAIKIRKKVETF